LPRPFGPHRRMERPYALDGSFGHAQGAGPRVGRPVPPPARAWMGCGAGLSGTRRAHGPAAVVLPGAVPHGRPGQWHIGMKELWLFTRQFPEGRGEAFLHTALTVWARHYDRVRVVPMFRGEGRAEMPGGVELVHLWDDAYRSLPKVDSLRQAPSILRAWRHRRGGGHPAHALSHVRQPLSKRDRVIAGLMPHYRPGQVHVLAAWMEDWVNVLGLVKERHPELRFATMAHRSDLFAERRAHGRIPFRAWQMERVDRVIAISQ